MATAQPPRRRTSHRAASPAWFDPDRHDQAVVQAEARRLAIALAPYRVLRKKSLERASGASTWHEGGFDRALCAAVREGLIERLPAGFYREGRGARARSSGLRPD